MSDEFHYCRTLGDDGGVDAVDGKAIGLDLESVLEDGLPPFKVALEILAACCEILDIAAEDGEIHGDIEPKHVFVDETGAVSIEAFGIDRSTCHAPEGEANELTDLYYLGEIAFKLFSPHKINPPMDDPDGHDDAVIDRVLGMNFEGMPEAFHGDVQWFVAKLMSFEPEDRPEAYEAWKTFIAFADETPGPFLEDWGAEAVEGGGERRDQEQAGRAMERPDEPSEEEEDLGGPVQASGPLKSALNFDGGTPKGQATAFWSKDAMKAALESGGDDEDDAAPKARPPVGAAQATAFWSKSDMQAMTDGGDKQADQRPKRRQPGRQKSRPAGPPKKPAPGPAGPSGPVAQQAAPPPTPHAVPPPIQPVEEANNTPLIIAAVAGIVIIGLLVCGGLTGVGGLAVVMGGGEEGAEKADKDKPKKKERPVKNQDTGGAGKNKTKKKASKPSAKPSPKKRSSSSRRSSKPSPRRASPRPKPKPKPAAAPAPTGGPAKVNFKSNGRGSVSCAGKSKNFDGIATIIVDEFQLPATCLVTIGSGRGVFQVYGSGSVTCDESGGSVNCSPMSVGG